MKNRRGFLTALTAVSGTALAFTVAAQADLRPAGAAPSDAAAAPSESGRPNSAPPSSPPKPRAVPSSEALAIAATFRRFDAKLTDADIERIAGKIDDSRAGAVLNPKKKPLRNSDEMVARFTAGERLV